jgi:hypothetical protein
MKVKGVLPAVADHVCGSWSTSRDGGRVRMMRPRSSLCIPNTRRMSS